MWKTILLLTAPLAIAAAPAPRPLTGAWAGDHLALRVLDTATVVQGDCTSGKISGPILLDSKGGFVASGYFNVLKPGLRLSDIAPRDRPALFQGKVTGDRLALTMKVNGQPGARRFTLKRGGKISFPSCS